jgi:3-phosphoshikimate 1-carboxyvinyltransferase
MQYIVKPAPLRGGSIAVPGDKSISHRALMLGAIAEGDTRVTGFLPGEDCKATLAALRNMGVSIEELDRTTLRISGAGMHGLQQPAAALDMGNSGTAMRLFAGLLCGQAFATTLLGDASLSKRPMARVIDPLSRMGASIESNNGLPPLIVHGGQRLNGIDYSLPVASAQVKSAILLAALYAEGESHIIEPATTRDHTERMLQFFGVKLQAENGRIHITGRQVLQAADVGVPGDLSSASFIMLAALLAPECEVILGRVGVNPTRCGVIQILRQMGAAIELEPCASDGLEPVANIKVSSSSLHGIDVDPALVSLAIDEFPVLFVAAAAAKGRTRFTGIGELRVKESDRISTMAEGLRRLGIQVQETDDGASVLGGAFTGGTVESHGDHRVAMSLAIAGTIAASPVTVLDTDAVDTSFPGFAACLRAAGADISSVTEQLTP